MARLVSLAILSGCLALACSGNASEVEGPKPAIAQASAASNSEPRSEPKPEEQPMRVLVTGFNDWRELGEPPKVWRCRDNPSCRLLLGEEHDAKPREFAGPLVTRLRAASPRVEWQFATMPVTWGVFAEVPTDVDVVVNIGLGVYDRFDALQLEAGAYNLRRGIDASAVDRSGPIVEDAEFVLPAPGPIVTRLEQLTGQTIAGYEIVVAEAREGNSYLCNETHYYALSALARADGRLREVYFLHIPHAKDGDYDSLADGVAGVVLGLLGA